MLKDSYGRVLKKVEEKKEEADAPKTDYSGRVIKTLKPPDEKKDVKMIAGSEERKVETEADEKFVKHQPFDRYLAEERAKCKIKTSKGQEQLDLNTDKNVSYKAKMTTGTKGLNLKDMPPTVILKRQEYRHVDYVSFMNFKEISQFVGAWQQTGMYE